MRIEKEKKKTHSEKSCSNSLSFQHFLQHTLQNNNSISTKVNWHEQNGVTSPIVWLVYYSNLQLGLKQLTQIRDIQSLQRQVTSKCKNAFNVNFLHYFIWFLYRTATTAATATVTKYINIWQPRCILAYQFNTKTIVTYIACNKKQRNQIIMMRKKK